MEHRNSTVITSAGVDCGRARRDLLDTVAHEFFHCWNVERIRPKGLEPFDFDRANISGELWLAEGFTQYYGPLALQRAGSWTSRRPPRHFDRPDRGGRRAPATSCDRRRR